MTALEARFEEVQEKLLELLERNPETLDEQIEYWELVKWENIYYNAARRKGIHKLGFSPVPSLQASEHGAKEAIGMKLQLTNLKSSGFGSEKWTLADTSSMTYLAPPKHTFKKLSKPVTVTFDSNSQNAVRYTCWSHVYYLNDNDMYVKSYSNVDVHGVYYIRDSRKQYYVNFEKDARKYSSTGQWDVSFENKHLSSSIASSSGHTATVATPETTVTSTQASAAAASAADSQEETPGSTRKLLTATYHRILRDRGSPRPASRSRSRSSTSTSSSGSSYRPGSRRSSSGRGARRSRGRSWRRTRSRSQSTERSRGGGGGRGRGRPRRSGLHSRPSRSPAPKGSGVPKRRPSVRAPQSYRGGSQQGTPPRPTAVSVASATPDIPRLSPWFRRRSHSTPRSPVRAPGRGSPPASLGSVRHHQSSQRKRSRSHERLHSAVKKDPYVILVRGKPNQLKCWRWRLHNRARRVPFRCFSTTFSWVSLVQGEKSIANRMLVVFDTRQDRELFLHRVTFPPGVTWCYGSLDCI
ncbi:E2 [Capra hircus papillomavirus 1]|uniref:Regulatory protein E2 n=1 Tax=Capra hircus papillomavirus 1 TaxID=338903 RepID=Q1I124_9PAPI|nr:E2 [Capra hircus papillomavirus 1]AAZ39804.1 E2 [Capra hircus papillomavirus 1]